MQLVILIANEESIKVKATNIDTNCFNESSFINCKSTAKQNHIEEIIGCDDNNDGISEYFDTKK
jgi:hypothetical protein